jgi:hypothetical protein
MKAAHVKALPPRVIKAGGAHIHAAGPDLAMRDLEVDFLERDDTWSVEMADEDKLLPIVGRSNADSGVLNGLTNKFEATIMVGKMNSCSPER